MWFPPGEVRKSIDIQIIAVKVVTVCLTVTPVLLTGNVILIHAMSLIVCHVYPAVCHCAVTSLQSSVYVSVCLYVGRHACVQYVICNINVCMSVKGVAVPRLTGWTAKVILISLGFWDWLCQHARLHLHSHTPIYARAREHAPVLTCSQSWGLCPWRMLGGWMGWWYLMSGIFLPFPCTFSFLRSIHESSGGGGADDCWLWFVALENTLVFSPSADEGQTDERMDRRTDR